MAQGKKDHRPKDPIVPLHIANASGLNAAQKKAYAASAGLKTAIPRDRGAPKKARQKGRGSSGAPAKKQLAHGSRPKGKRSRAKLPSLKGGEKNIEGVSEE